MVASRAASFHTWLASRFPTVGGDARQIAKRFRHDLPRCISPDPAVLETLAGLKAKGIPLALLSNGLPAFQMAKLRACGAARFFPPEHRFFSGSLGMAKPEAACFATVASALGLAAEEILFIGDDPVRDIGGARQAGMQACRLLRDGRQGAVSERFISSLRELPELLGIQA